MPEGESIVFDVEVLYKISPYPVLAIGMSSNSWYSWIMPGLLNNHCQVPSTLIPFGNPDSPRIIIGHNVGYDRARIKDEYHIKPTAFQFIDTMSLHCSIGGLSNQQRVLWKMHQKDIVDGVEITSNDWKDHASMNSLLHVAKLYIGKDMDKSARDEFGIHTVESLSEESTLQRLLKYCAEDVSITHQVFKAQFPKFLLKCPNPASFVGMLQMAKLYLPTIKGTWTDYISSADLALTKVQDQIEEKLNLAAQDALKLFDMGMHTENQWLKHLDWLVKPIKMVPEKISKGKVVSPARPYKNAKIFLEGKPEWYRELWDPKAKRIRLSPGMRIVPYLLEIEWKGCPLMHCSTYGWMYYSPKSVTKITESNPALDMSVTGIDFDSNCDYFRIPHSDGIHKNCGNPLAKSYIKACESNVLTSKSKVAMEILKLNSECVYWISARKRVMSQFLVEGGPENITGLQGTTGNAVILPQSIPMGTVTRRAVEPLWLTAANARKAVIGTELKSKIMAPDGYCFVGADVDSQELWISSLLGDSQFGIHGATAFGFMTLQGTKAKGTDLHSKTGQIAHISRDQAKVFNYSRIYGAGAKATIQLLLQCNASLTRTEASAIVANLYRKTKGTRHRFLDKTLWHGGSESYVFNELERIARSPDCRTPFLECQIPDSLLPKYVKGDVIPL